MAQQNSMLRFGIVPTLTPDSTFIILTTDSNGQTTNARVEAQTAAEQFSQLRWMLPPPSSTLDTRGSEGSESFDANFYYIKTGGVWKRIAFNQSMFG